MPEVLEATPLLDKIRAQGGALPPDEVIGLFLPLVRQVIEVHEGGKVAPLVGLGSISVSAGHAWFKESECTDPQANPGRLRELQHSDSKAIDVVKHVDWTHDFTELETEIANRRVGDWTQALEHPIYLPGYVCWEHAVTHQDPLTDVFVLGLILASLTLGLDLTEHDDVDRFVSNRPNLYALYPKLNPVLEKAIVQTTELVRHSRLQDLRVLVHRLENYRDLQADHFDFDQTRGLQHTALDTRRKVVLSTLRDRLFEISRRNRLIYFKPTAATTNLTEASVPILLSLENVRREHLFVWTDKLRSDIVKGREIPLKRTIRFEECPYVPAALDKARSQARKDRKEFGFSQLRLVLCFFRWHNLKEDPDQRINSPLLLLPVELDKKRGIRDSYVLRATSPIAEVNPALRYYLKQLYDLDLPEAVDLEQTDLDELHQHLEAAIKLSEPSLDLRKIDKPRIDLIYASAQQRLDRYRKKARLSGRGIKQYGDVDFSYTRSNFQPLGLQLFLRKVKPTRSTITDIIGSRPPTASAMAPTNTVEKRKKLYSLSRGANNPYTWEFDTCAMTLGNFNYRKMTLVRDYTSLIDEEITTPCFERLFALEPKEIDNELAAAPSLADAHHVVDCDPTQSRAIASCRERDSVIIQGPPGTGKSQTITNLIADFCARGKRVLFVCEKRAAIDVVYHRLRGRGLHHLCCLIHDSQTDKKAFVHDLRARYQAYITHEPPVDSWDRRKELVAEAERIIGTLENHDRALQAVDDPGGVSALELYRRLVELGESLPDLDAGEAEALPPYRDWTAQKRRLDRIYEMVRATGHRGAPATHPLCILKLALLRTDQPIAAVTTLLEEARAAHRVLASDLASRTLPPALVADLGKLRALVAFAERLRDLATSGLLELLRPDSPRSRELDAQVNAIGVAKRAVSEAAESTANWKTKLAADEAEDALHQSRTFEANIFTRLTPAYWQLRAIMNASYDFGAHTVQPSWSAVLGKLIAEHEARRTALTLSRDFLEQYGLGDSVDDVVEAVRALREEVTSSEIGLALLSELERSGSADDIVRLGQSVAKLDGALGDLLRQADLALEELPEVLDRVDNNLSKVPDMAAVAGELQELPDALAEALMSRDLPSESLEAAIAWHSLEERCRRDRTITSLPMAEVERHLARLDLIYREVLAINASAVLAGVVNGFRRNLQISAMPTSQLSRDDKAFKKRYAAGRRVLEREFNKKMRYRAIRELMEAESGPVIRDLKPVWLMSPLSVADTLPLDPDLFDVVVFDEASQIPLEEAIPAIHRARKMIVVGDEMQLPPTNFFSARSVDDDESRLVELDSESFLSMASRQLPTTMLGWHYRSRSEALISFSNACFYKGDLLTIPETRMVKSERPAIEVSEAVEGRDAVDAVLSRSISFHKLDHGVYEDRRNRAEANYIANLVAGLLVSKCGHTLGIVAFSEAQQTEIENALDTLANADPDLRELLDQELEREVDDQFSGLFVKNLENVQGDERDIIILSICYGPDRSGRMRMNFGPINQNGGEKRLNVIFSRAKHHMVVVSSIQYTQITNVYNDGANCFRRYLQYAAAVSEGRHESAARVLSELALDGASSVEHGPPDPVAVGISEALEEIGYSATLGVGQSGFSCDVAIFAEDDDSYRLGILVDTDRFYGGGDVLERYLLRPQLLQAFGWNLMLVKTSDWYANRETVLDRILRRLKGQDLPPEREVVSVQDPYADATEGSGLSSKEFDKLIAEKFGETGGKVDYGKVISESITTTANVAVHESIVDLKEELVSKLEDLSRWVDGEYRKAAYANGARVVSRLTDEELRSRVTYKDIKGIGKGLNEIMVEYRNTGKIAMWERLSRSRR